MDEDITIKPTGSGYFHVFFSAKPNTENMKLLSNLFLSLTEAGRLMARYCIAFDTMKQFSKVSGTENLSDLVGFLYYLMQMHLFKTDSVLQRTVLSLTFLINSMPDLAVRSFSCCLSQLN